MTSLAVQAPTLFRRDERARLSLELGHEPAIQLASAPSQTQERRRAPWRWMAGVALAGLCGLALIGSALYLDLDRQSTFAAAPEFAAAARNSDAGGEGVNPGKGDRLVRPVDIVAAKQSFKVITPIKMGDREVLKARPYTLLSTTLTTTPTRYAASVPPFDPLKVNNSGAEKGEAPVDLTPLQDDSEVTFASRDLTPADIASVTGDLTLAEAQAQVSESIRAQAAGERRFAMAPQMLLMRTSRAGVDPLGALSYATTGVPDPTAPFPTVEVRMVMENVTNASRTSEGGRDSTGERLVRARSGQSFEELLRENGAGPEAISAILAAFGVKRGESPVADGQKVILQYTEPTSPGGRPAIARISIYADEQLKAAVATKDDGEYVYVTPRSAQPAKRAGADEGGLSLYQSLYETALKQGLPKFAIDEMVRTFANDVDFQRSVQPGDAMTSFMSDGDEIEPHPQLLFATLTVRDQTFRYYRFQTADDNLVDFYDENGRSTRKFLLRKPISTGEITSGFGMRFHPILHFSRMHTGVDWGAPIGTPIVAAGNGVVIKAEYDSGYGRRVEIQHANGYVTTYNHMSGFGRGITAGVRVTQGQVVGYLGQTGLATGPHLHYEVIINGNFVDPMAIKLARTREFDGKMLGLFKRERERIDGLMAQAPNATAAAPGPSAKVN